MITKELVTLLIIIVIWDVIWKAIGLWRAGRNNQLGWFIAILILNTAGLLEIIYLLFFQKDENIFYGEEKVYEINKPEPVVASTAIVEPNVSATDNTETEPKKYNTTPAKSKKAKSTSNKSKSKAKPKTKKTQNKSNRKKPSA